MFFKFEVHIGVSLAILEQLAFNAQKFTGVTWPWPRPLLDKFLRVMCGLSQRTCLPNLKSVALNVLALDSGNQLHYKIDGPKFADPSIAASVLNLRSLWFMQILAGVPSGGGVKWECGRCKWRFSLLSFTVFRTFYMLSRDTTVNDLGDIQGHYTVSYQISQERCVIRQKLL